jgi:hypothetical protein
MVGAAATSITVAQAVITTSGVLLVLATGVSRPAMKSPTEEVEFAPF